MTRTRPAGRTVVGALTSTILLLTTGCTAQSDTHAPAAVTQSSPPAAAMRIDKPATLLGTWTESVDRGFHDRAEQQMGTFKKLLAAGPTSAMGTAYVRAEEVHSGERGLHIPNDDQRVILISAVSGTITDPTVALDKTFAGLPNVTAVGPIQPGALGGVAGCGIIQAKTGIPVDVCVWSDQHTLGMVTLVGFAQTDDPRGVFGQIRAELERPAR
ncbi:hypothetical protein LADH09A_005819 [Micromonospora sp. LAH09]|uniref:hypothetical protein n=1 Tax=Micromonospora cabrerizensis TaxID=2911213 RepID=UPI001EE866C4|nr:hypothetical protein [Micromonospora cabrerizensis]MCG5471817.1 hypothetical protein [Micromonospora cabrerizensis]